MLDAILSKPDDAGFGLMLELRLAVALGPTEEVGPCHDGGLMKQL